MRREKRRTGLLLLMAALLVTAGFVLCGCGKPPAEDLEAYAKEHPEVKKQLEESAAMLGGDDMDVEIAFSGNDINATGTLTQTYEEETLESLVSTLDSYDGVIEGAAEEMIAKLEKDSEFTGIRLRIVVLNGDGSEVWKRDYINTQ